MHKRNTLSPTATFPSNVPSCRSLSSSEAGPSGPSSLSDGELARNLQDSIKHRILYLSEQLRVEKASRARNTVGFLKLVSTADRHQAPHIWQAFEKVNQHASATVAQIERRLHRCHQQLQELEEGCRPKGLALRAESSLGDNCEQPSEKALFSEPPKPGAEDCPSTGLFDVIRHFSPESHSPALRQRRSSETKHGVQPRDLLWQKVKEELIKVKTFHLSLQVSYQSLKERYVTNLQALLESLWEEKCRQVQLEGQVNEHLQGHLDKIYHLKQNLACTEERMAYLSYERAKEIWEVMDTFKSRVVKLEALQQVTQLEVTEGVRSRPRGFLVLVSSACACPVPLLNSRLRTGTAFLLVGLDALAWQKQHAIPAADWQAWVPSRWRLCSGDSKPLPEGP
ncbi:testis-specific protein TEX28 [Balaenoptera musculus]|uniref:Testis-specific protein TEX28 n=1 Tax=Balaenoptera musculus TaxID=9771 RepID=A0A8B8WDL4_BALMU|nr:testis-specific protein TEX28 [Balaenoptera musculus]